MRACASRRSAAWGRPVSRSSAGGDAHDVMRWCLCELVPVGDLLLGTGQHLVPVLQLLAAREHERSQRRATDDLV